MKTTRLLSCCIAILVMAVLALVMDEDLLRATLPYLYLGTFLSAAYAIHDPRDLVFAYYRPSSIMILYCSLFFFMGTLAFKHGWVHMEAGQQYEFYWLDNLGAITFYFLIAMAVTLATQQLNSRRAPLPAPSTERRVTTASSPMGGAVVMSLLLAGVSLVAEIPLPGGSGDFSTTFFMFAAIHLAYVAKLRKHKSRIVAYAVLALMIAIFFFRDRRLLFYFGFIICLIELHDRVPFRIRFRNVAIFGALAVALVATNIAMSIQRGVGDFGSRTLPESFTYVDDYLASDWARTMLFHNFEGPPATFHSYNAVNYMIESGDYKLGTTLIKILFLPLPRDQFPNKPRSMVDEYTDIHYPAYRARGGSFVPNFYSEAYWNFGLAGGLVYLTIFFALADGIYLRWMTRLRRGPRMGNVFFLASFAFLLYLYRGSGFDLYGLFVIIFYFTTSIYIVCTGKRRRPIRKVADPDSAEAHV